MPVGDEEQRPVALPRHDPEQRTQLRLRQKLDVRRGPGVRHQASRGAGGQSPPRSMPCGGEEPIMATTSVTLMGHAAHLMVPLSMASSVRGGFHTPHTTPRVSPSAVARVTTG